MLMSWCLRLCHHGMYKACTMMHHLPFTTISISCFNHLSGDDSEKYLQFKVTKQCSIAVSIDCSPGWQFCCLPCSILSQTIYHWFWCIWRCVWWKVLSLLFLILFLFPFITWLLFMKPQPKALVESLSLLISLIILLSMSLNVLSILSLLVKS